MVCGHGRSWRATVAKPVRREVLLRVRLCLRGAMGDTADLGSVAIWYEGSSPFAGIVYGSVVQLVGSDGVAGKMLRWSILSESPSSCAAKAELVYAAASKAVPVRGMSSTLIRNIIFG